MYGTSFCFSIPDISKNTFFDFHYIWLSSELRSLYILELAVDFKYDF